MTANSKTVSNNATASNPETGSLATHNQYKVLARKYRSQTFSELIGQDALVRTLTHALESGRVHHAYMLTGIRGTGKTSTARIIAKALNCTGPDGQGAATPNPCGVCDNCKAITSDRHVDVIEMDAASHTGVDDMRDIIDSVRYAPIQARYKVYIIDEVHMLSKSAFNALLKTLEEPPEHIVFIFATTEIRKVPPTVLSRCQRFDLKRVPVLTLSSHYKAIAEKEGMHIDDEAVNLIARSADGSVRDGLSLLDQAIAQSDSNDITANAINAMLGLADKELIFKLIRALFEGKTDDALTLVNTLYTNGADAEIILQDLLDAVHLLTRIKTAPALMNSEEISLNEKQQAQDLLQDLSVAALTRVWQMLLKGVSEINMAGYPIKALEMLIIRTIYAGTLPTPEDILNSVSAQNSTEKKTLESGLTPSIEPQTKAIKSETPASCSPIPMHQEKKANDNKDINLESNNIADVSGTNLITLQTIYRTMQNNNASLLASQLYLYTAENAVSPDCLSLYVDANAPADLQKNVKQFCSLNFTNLTIQFEKEKLGITLSEKDAHTKQEKIAAVSGHAGLKPLLEKISSYNIVEIKDNA